jgi:hypothetical protein
MKGKGDKGGKSKRQNAQLAQSEFDSFAFFFLLILFSKFLSLHSNFRFEKKFFSKILSKQT